MHFSNFQYAHKYYCAHTFAGVYKPRVSCNNTELPNARLISITLHNEVNRTHENLTHLGMIFGQFLTHDITFVSFAPLSSIEFELGTFSFKDKVY